MTIELVFLLAALWILLGLIGAWVLYEHGQSGWRWFMVCVLAGPLSLSVVYDRMDLADDESSDPDSEAAATETRHFDESDEMGSPEDIAADWPRDDPEGRLFLLGHRGISER